MDETWVDPAAEWHGVDTDDIGQGRLGVTEGRCIVSHRTLAVVDDPCPGCGAAV